MKYFYATLASLLFFSIHMHAFGDTVLQVNNGVRGGLHTPKKLAITLSQTDTRDATPALAYNFRLRAISGAGLIRSILGDKSLFQAQKASVINALKSYSNNVDKAAIPAYGKPPSLARVFEDPNSANGPTVFMFVLTADYKPIKTGSARYENMYSAKEKQSQNGRVLLGCWVMVFKQADEERDLSRITVNTSLFDADRQLTFEVRDNEGRLLGVTRNFLSIPEEEGSTGYETLGYANLN
jgi:hypothetical protein